MTVNNIIVSFNFHIFAVVVLVASSAIVFLRMQNYTRILFSFSSTLPGRSIFHFLAINFMAARKSARYARTDRRKENCHFSFLGIFMYLSIYELHFYSSVAATKWLLFYLVILLEMCKYCSAPFNLMDRNINCNEIDNNGYWGLLCDEENRK